MIRSRATFALIAASAMVVALLSACSSEGSDSSPDAGSGAESAPTDAKSADPSLEPVTIGFRNLEGGAFSQDDMRKGFEGAVEYVNAELGGINGRPLKAILCKTDLTPESSVNCANKFVADDVVLATQGIDFAADASLPILQEADIVDTSTFAWGPSQNTAVGDAYVSYASNEEGYAAGVVQLANMGAKSVAVVFVDVPAQHAVMDSIVLPAAERLGITVEPFYYSSPTDWTSLAATIMAKSTDAISFFGVEADCLAAVPAMRTLGYEGTIHAGSCYALADSLEPSEMTDVIISNSIYTDSMDPVPDEIQAEINIFDRYSEDRDIQNGGQAMQGFTTGVWVADLLSQVPGDITAKSVKESVGTAKGDVFFRTTGYDCSKPTWPGTTACGTGFFFTKVDSQGGTEVLPDQPVDVSGILPPS